MIINKKIILGFIIVLSSLILFSSLALGKLLITNNQNYNSDPAYYKTVANEMVRQGAVIEAISAYESALSLQEDLNIRNNLAVLYYQKREYANAINHLRVLLEAEPKNPSHHYDLAVNLVDNFRYTENKNVDNLFEALSEYEAAEKLSPGFENAENNIQVLKRILEVSNQ